MSFTKINAAGIGSTETITISGISVVGDGSFGGNVSVAGTLTYEDVTNIDSVGLITARNGIVVGSGITLSSDGDGFYTGVVTATTFNGSLAASNLTGALPAIDGSALTGVGGTENVRTGILDVAGIATFRSNTLVGSGITLSPDGNAFHTGIVTATSVTGVGTVTSVTASGIDLSGLLREGVKITAGKLSDNTNIDLENGMVHYFTTQETTTSTPNIRFSSSVTLNDVMQIGESVAVTIITTAAAGGYSAQLTIDGAAVTENWVGGSAPSDGGSSGVDIHAYTIIKTANATFTVIANQSKTS